MEPLHTEKQIHEKTGLPLPSLRHWRYLTKRRGVQIGPVFRIVAGRVFYRLKDVTDWIKREEIVSNHSRKYAG